jgi:RluA family pseudouridine synthase
MKRLQTRIPGSLPKIRLDHFLANWLPYALGQAVSKTKIRTLILTGGVYVNRHRNKTAATPLYAGTVIEVYYDEERLNAGQATRLEKVRLETSRVLFEDEWLIVIDKASGLPTQPTVDPNRANLYEVVRNFLADRDHIANPYLGLHHRLDKDTSGIVLFTKKEEANKGVSELFSNHVIQKTYQCLVWRSPGSPTYELGEQFKLENFLGRLNDKSEKSRFGAVKSGGDYAVTYFNVQEIFRDILWLEAQPKTGRTHQIRVHCSEHGLPILGDPMYFPKELQTFASVPRLMLHASELSFIHPITEKTVIITCPLPDDFMSVLGALKA